MYHVNPQMTRILFLFLINKSFENLIILFSELVFNIFFSCVGSWDTYRDCLPHKCQTFLLARSTVATIKLSHVNIYPYFFFCVSWSGIPYQINNTSLAFCLSFNQFVLYWCIIINFLVTRCRQLSVFVNCAVLLIKGSIC